MKDVISLVEKEIGHLEQMPYSCSGSDEERIDRYEKEIKQAQARIDEIKEYRANREKQIKSLKRQLALLKKSSA